VLTARFICGRMIEESRLSRWFECKIQKTFSAASGCNGSQKQQNVLQLRHSIEISASNTPM
jgi:hypothetical protein